MEALYLVEATDNDCYMTYTLYMLTNLKDRPTKLVYESGFSVWGDDISAIDWAHNKVYEMIGDEIVSDTIFIQEL